MKLNCKNPVQKVQLAECKIAECLLKYGFQATVIALHNLCAHGKCFKKINDDALYNLFNAYEEILTLAKNLEINPLQIRR